MHVQLLVAIACFFPLAYANLPPFLQESNTWAQETLASLTLPEKIGQLFVVAAASDFEQPTEILAASMFACPYRMDEEYVSSLIRDYHIGGIIFLYKSTPLKQFALTQKFQSLSKIPLLIALDAEWGLGMRLDKDPSKVVQYPRNMILGALPDATIIYQIGYEIGQQCAALGVHMCLAPVVDVNTNPENPVMHDRSFGDNPEKVAHLGTLFAQGLHDAGILACAKHFPGHGDTSVDSHHDLPVILHTQERLGKIELFPFEKLIENNIPAIMTAHLAIPAFDVTHPSSMSYETVTNLLKKEMNFKGLIITDGLGMKAITKKYNPGELELQAFLAGNDILLCPLDVPKACKLIEEAVVSGKVFQEELDQRVLKILQAKAWAFSHQKNMSPEDAQAFLIRPEAYELARQAYQQAITAVK